MPFEYLEPVSIEKAIALLVQYGDKARVIAGGTDIIVKIGDKAMAPEYLVDITSISGLDGISFDADGGLRIGALTAIRTLEISSKLRQRYPIITQAANQMASVPIRNVQTIGGNLCNAAPSADTAPPLLTLLARAKINGPSGERVVPLDDFFAGPGSTVLKSGELLTEIQVPPPLPNTKGVYLKHSIRGSVDLAIVGVAVVATVEPTSEVCHDIKIALGAVAPIPVRATRAEGVLRGQKVSVELISRSAQIASEEARPISDCRGSAEYRTEIVKVLTQRAIRESVDR